MRVVLDYRAALRDPSGVGEFSRCLAMGLLSVFRPIDGRSPLDLTLFSSSWKDRLALSGELADAKTVDRRVPVRVLNLAWHRLQWPPAEMLAGHPFDVAHSLHPLLMPARDAAQVITIHDLDFMLHPERTSREIRRDYPALARRHAARADRVIVVSHFTAEQTQRLLDVPADRISVCSPGAPAWPARTAGPPQDAYILFFGTLEPRKNVGTLIEAYERVSRRRPFPRLVLAGKATEAASPWLARINGGPLRDRIHCRGYIAPSERQPLYGGALCLVQPSFDEGFGLPVLEAMTAGVPVVAANRGALPEVLGDAGLLVDAEDPDQLAAAIERIADDEALQAQCTARGIERARTFTWEGTALKTFTAYEHAIRSRAERRGAA